jgi:hypothetical protein
MTALTVRSVCLSALFCFLAAGLATGQDIRLKFEGRYDARQLDELLEKDPPNLDNKEAETVKAAACYHIYPLTLSENQFKPGEMDKLVKYTEDFIKKFCKKKPTSKARQECAKQTLAALQLILSNVKQPAVARVNAGRLLMRLAAESGMEETADVAREVIAEPKQNDGARYYCFKAVRELYLALGPQATIKDKQREGQLITALVQFIERKNPVTSLSAKDEIEGLQTVRREAVKALALCRTPALASNPKVRPALTLARVVGIDGSLSPEPRLDERLEAAIGLASLDPKLSKDYQPHYAVYQIGSFLKDYSGTYLAEKGKRPWKTQAARLNDALKDLDATDPKDAYTKTLTGLASRILASIETDSNPDPAQLAIWLENNKPVDTKSLFKGADDAVVQPATPKDSTEEKKPSGDKDKEK